MLIGASRNRASASLWNLALDPYGGPTNGGCTTCRGVLTIDPATGAVTRNVEYWLLAQFGRGVRPGAVRVDSTASNPTGVQSVAFVNPDGSHALVLYNEGGSAQPVTVRWAGKVARVRVAVRSRRHPPLVTHPGSGRDVDQCRTQRRGGCPRPCGDLPQRRGLCS